MSEERKKGKHLRWEDRQEIQRGLREYRSFTEIGIMIGCSPDTVSKEIRKHRYHKAAEKRAVQPNRCKYRENCRKRNICGKRGNHKCVIPYRQSTATGAESYQWYYRKTADEAWTAVSAAAGKTASYSLTAQARYNGYEYYCEVTNSAGTVKTNVVKLTVK